MQRIANRSRREFVAGGLIVATVGLSGCSGGGTADSGTVSTPTSGQTTASVPLTQSEVGEWEKLVGNAFVISTESGSTLATLAALERLDVGLDRPTSLARHQPFYAYFEMDLRLAPKGDKIYQVAHTAKGAFSLFLGQPSDVRGKGVVLAAFN